MKQRLAHLFMHWPALYNSIARVYSFAGSLIGTRVVGKWWATRSSFAKSYWDSWDLPSRHFLVERIAAFSPIDGILEVGCASGPNLYVLAKKFPKAQIVGIDINREAIEYGKARFAQEGILNVRLLVSKADDLRKFQDKAFDLVFTDAVLTHIGPNRIKKVVSEMLRITRRALILMEPHSFELNDKDLLKLGILTYYGGQWIRSYTTLLKQFVPEEQIRVTKIPEGVWPAKPWNELGAIVEVII
jgi:SAM-dependent methyltransferase